MRRDDRPRSHLLERIERRQPRLDARRRAGREKRLVHDDVTGEQDAVALHEEPRIAARVRRADDEEAHPNAAEIEHVVAVERDVGFAATGVAAQQFGHQRRSA